MTPVIIDAIVVAILVAFVVCGTFHGALRTLAGLLIVVAALVGAGMIASACSGPAAKIAAPLVEERIAEKVRSAMEETTSAETEETDLEALMERLGIDESLWQPLLERIRGGVAESGQEILDAVVEQLLRSVIYGLVFLVSFLLLLILLKLLVRALDLITLLPVLHGANALLGGILGFIEGGLLLFLAVWVVRKFGVSFETELFEGAYILKIFTANTPLSVLSFFH